MQLKTTIQQQIRAVQPHLGNEDLLQRLQQVYTQHHGSTIDASKVLSNLGLAISAAENFYFSEGDRADYFPHKADAEINSALSQASTGLSNFAAHPHPTHAQNAITASDLFYALCLQYGIITYGFDKQEISSALDAIRAARREATKLLKGAEKKSSELSNTLDEAIKKMQERSVEELEKAVREAKEAFDQSMELSAKAKEKFDQASAALEKLGAVEEQSETMLEGAKKACDSATSMAEETKESSRGAAAELAVVKENRAKIKAELEEIKAFYEQIEQYTGKMSEAKKEADAKFNELEGKYTELHEGSNQKTTAIVNANIKIQEEIKQHLQKAIGASLFGAFEKRRGSIGTGKLLWILIMIASLGCGVWLTLHLADSFKEGASGANVFFFLKLSAAIPLAFIVGFAGTQYAHERRAEEEYAFKAAISFSLIPFKDLLQKMKDDGHENQAKFVERLLSEIFDNPTKRIYSDKKATSDSRQSNLKLKDIKEIVGMAKDFDPDKVKKMADMWSEFTDMSGKSGR